MKTGEYLTKSNNGFFHIKIEFFRHKNNIITIFIVMKVKIYVLISFKSIVKQTGLPRKFSGIVRFFYYSSIGSVKPLTYAFFYKPGKPFSFRATIRAKYFSYRTCSSPVREPWER